MIPDFQYYFPYNVQFY